MLKSPFRRLRFGSLRSRLLALVVPPAVVGMSIAVFYVERTAYRALEQDLDLELRQLAELGGRFLAQQVWYFYDHDEISERLRILLRHEDVIAVVVRDPDDGSVRAWCDEASSPSCGIEEPWPGDSAEVDGRSEPIVSDVVFQDVRTAQLEIHATRQRLRQEILRRLRVDSLLLGFVLLAVTSAVSLATRRSVARPLTRLRQALGAAREGGLRPIVWDSSDEIGALVSDYNALAERESEHRSRLEEKLSLYEEAFESLDRGFCIFNRDFKLVAFNRSYAALLGYGEGELAEGMSLSRLMRSHAARGEYGGANVDALIIDRLAVAVSGEGYRRERKRPDGSVLEIDSQPLASGGFVSLYTEITQRKAREVQQRFLTLLDTLTRLPNRALFYDRLQQSLALADQTGQRLALLLVDIDRLREINKAHGAEVGDQLLQRIAERLGEIVRHSDTLARLDEDEFGVIQQCVEQVDDVALLAHRILGALRRPFEIADTTLQLSSSIGITVYPDDDRDSTHILHHAELALRAAKAEGRSRYRFFVPEVDRAVAKRRHLEEEIFSALQNGRLALHYRPRLDLGTGALMGVESLLFWNHPERGLLAPESFLELATQCGLIFPLTDWILKEACRQRLQWQHRRSGPWRVEIQLDERAFEEGDVAASVAAALAATALPPNLLAVEVSGPAFLEDAAAATAVRALRERGVAVLARGIGGGSSASYSILQRFPVDGLRIESRFLQDPSEDLESEAVVRALSHLGQRLGIRVVAEGVEEDRQLRWLREVGCAEASGNLFCAPLPADELSSWLVEGSVDEHVLTRPRDAGGD